MVVVVKGKMTAIQTSFVNLMRTFVNFTQNVNFLNA